METLSEEQRDAKTPKLCAYLRAAVIGLGLVMAALVILHLPGLNGPSFWKWVWREPRLKLGPLYLAMGLAALPILAAPRVWRGGAIRWRRILAVGLLLVGSFAMRVASLVVRSDPPSLIYIPAIVTDETATGYYADALAMSLHPLRDWIILYPTVMEHLHTHTKIKPPGLVLYWVFFIQTFDRNVGPAVDYYPALYGGLGLGILAVLGIAATYCLLGVILEDPDAAFWGAAFLSLCPGFVLFFPTFDPAYILLSTALIGFWYLALARDSTKWSVLLGVVLGATLFITFNILVIGAFMVAVIFVVPPAGRTIGGRLGVAAKHAGTAAGVTLAVLGLFWLAIGYDVIATFQSAWRNQHMQLARYADSRPYPMTVPFDLTDFALGSGWISAALVMCYFLTPWRDRRHDRFVWTVLALFALVAVTGLLPGETARVWNFMLPLLMIPVGLELSHWTMREQMGVLAVLALITITISQNMLFIY
jgi:hypothetical protein